MQKLATRVPTLEVTDLIALSGCRVAWEIAKDGIRKNTFYRSRL